MPPLRSLTLALAAAAVVHDRSPVRDLPAPERRRAADDSRPRAGARFAFIGAVMVSGIPLLNDLSVGALRGDDAYYVSARDPRARHHARPDDGQVRLLRRVGRIRTHQLSAVADGAANAVRSRAVRTCAPSMPCCLSTGACLLFRLARAAFGATAGATRPDRAAVPAVALRVVDVAPERVDVLLCQRLSPDAGDRGAAASAHGGAASPRSRSRPRRACGCSMTCAAAPCCSRSPASRRHSALYVVVRDTAARDGRCGACRDHRGGRVDAAGRPRARPSTRSRRRRRRMPATSLRSATPTSCSTRVSTCIPARRRRGR